MLEFDITAWLIGLTLLGLALFIFRRRGGWFALFFSIFWVYLLALVSATLFPIPFYARGTGAGGWQAGSAWWRPGALNLVPFYFDRCWDLPRPCAQGIWENILMTIPFGFGVNFLARFKPRQYGWLALAPGLAVEASQFFMCLLLGVNYRTVDVNDVIFNALGAGLGLVCFRVFAWVFLALAGRMGLARRGGWAYLREMCAVAGENTRAKTAG